MRIVRRTKALFKEIKWRHQRAKRGFSDYDVYEINTWFMHIMPKMLLELKKKNNGVPYSIEHTYYEEHDIEPLNLTEEEKEKCINEAAKIWDSILEEMIYHFNEVNDETCCYKNKYDEEYHKAFEEFSKKYGMQGEKLKGNLEVEIIKDENGKIVDKLYKAKEVYRFEDVSEENARISKLYFEENGNIFKYRMMHQKKALEMFVKYFDDLWW